MRKVILLPLLIAGLSGCIREERKINVEFRQAEHEAYARAGTASVTGQAFLRQQGGAVVRCSGETVMLFPATSYFREAIATYRQGYKPKFDMELDERMKKIARRATCDADGKFAFNALPAGDWFVLTQVRWNAGSSAQGGEVLGEVKTVAGKPAEVILADGNRV